MSSMENRKTKSLLSGRYTEKKSPEPEEKAKKINDQQLVTPTMTIIERFFEPKEPSGAGRRFESDSKSNSNPHLSPRTMGRSNENLADPETQNPA